MPQLAAAIQMVGLEEKPMRASWSKLTNHVMPEKAKSGGTVEAHGRASSTKAQPSRTGADASPRSTRVSGARSPFERVN
jgi:hypothetical protein